MSNIWTFLSSDSLVVKLFAWGIFFVLVIIGIVIASKFGVWGYIWSIIQLVFSHLSELKDVFG